MQQVNLYQPLFRKQEKVFSSKTMLQGAALVLIGLLLFSAHVYNQGSGIRAQLKQAEQLRDARAKQLMEAVGQFPEKMKDATLEQQVSYFREQVRQRQQLLQTLQSQDQGSSEGFSEYLAGLARQRTSQLWLQRVVIAAGGNDIRLQGRSYDPDQVPQFIQRLADEKAFEGRGFGYFVIERDPKAERQVSFSLSTRPPEGDEAKGTGGQR